MQKEIENQLNKIAKNNQIIEDLKKEKENIISEELNSEEILNKFKKHEEKKITKSFENKAIIKLNGGYNMPKKAIAEKLKQSDKFKIALKEVENENINLKILRSATSFTDITFIQESEKKTFISNNLQNEKNREKCKNIDEQINKLKKENKNINHDIKMLVVEDMEAYDFENLVTNLYDDMLNYAIIKIENYFKNSADICFEKVSFNYYYRRSSEYIEISKENIQEYFEWLEEFNNLDDLLCDIITNGEDYIESFIYKYTLEHLPEEMNTYTLYDEANTILTDTLTDIIFDLYIGSDFSIDLNKKFTSKYIIELLKQNKKYGKFIDYIDYVNNEIEEKILTKIPNNYINLYPSARKIKRHFVLHIGPTNSGKTWSALNNLKKFNNGIYLAPLRLLAFEKFEELNNDGYICSLKTGEEQIIKKDANFISSTIEMANFTNKYNCAVIDECQMVNDENRGGAWTNAILGLVCPEIHLCLSSNAKDILIKLINECNDTYEVVEYERKNELICEKEKFNFYNEIKKGDALIVFSKRSVYAVAAELQEKNIKCSIIYGALPYDVKQSEAEKFNKGVTDVVVATDAIGMGLNLPIKRIIFMEIEKFDGKIQRKLYSTELKQIAGRAGRYGINEYGLYNVYASNKDKEKIKKDIEKDDFQISYARLSFPEILINIEGNISDILSKWNEIETNKFYIKQDLDVQIQLAKDLEKLSENKQLIYNFITIGFDTKNDELKELWKDIFNSQKKSKKYNIPNYLILDIKNIKKNDLNELEEMFKICDLLYQYYDKFNYLKEMEEITKMRQKISKQMIELLKNKKISRRKCSCCNCNLPLLWRYGMCEECYEEQYGYEDDDNYDDEDDWLDYV